MVVYLCLAEARAALINTSLDYCPSALCCCPKVVPTSCESVCIVPAVLPAMRHCKASVVWFVQENGVIGQLSF